MKASYKTVVNYVKNLFPGVAPVASSDNPQLDAMVVYSLTSLRLYIVARNGHRYWYCFVNQADIPVARYILRSNGVRVETHNSYYSFGREPVLRVRTAYLTQNPNAKKFVDSVDKLDRTMIDDGLVKSRIEQIRQKMK